MTSMNVNVSTRPACLYSDPSVYVKTEYDTGINFSCRHFVVNSAICVANKVQFSVSKICVLNIIKYLQ